MAGRYVNTKFWVDRYITELNTNEKLLFLYLITNPHCTSCGIYEIPFKTISNDTGLSTKEMNRILNKFHIDGKVYFDNGWVALKNFIKNQNTGSADFMKGMERDLLKCPKNLVSFVKGDSGGRVGGRSGDGALLTELTKPNLKKEELKSYDKSPINGVGQKTYQSSKEVFIDYKNKLGGLK